MKFLKIILFIVVVVIFESCKDKPVTQIPLTIASFGKIGNKSESFPAFYERLCYPVEADSKSKNNFALSPIMVKRLDNSNEFLLNIISNEKNSNTNSLSYRTNMVKKYFLENTLPDLLTAETSNMSDKTNSINTYLRSLSKKSKIYFFSEKAKSDNYNNEKLYDDIDSLRNDLAKYLSENGKSDIVIIINPEVSLGSSVDTTTLLIQDTASININTDNPKTLVESNSNNELLRNTLLNIANSQLSFNQRLSYVNEAMKNIFSKHLIVETYINSAGVASHLWDKGHGKEYLENLATESSILDFKILAYKDSIPNVSYLQVIEVHKQ